MNEWLWPSHVTGSRRLKSTYLQTTSLGEPKTTLYRNVKLAKPNAKLFELPASYRKYTDLGALMQDMMMKQLSGGR